MSKVDEDKLRLIKDVVTSIKRFQDAVDLFDAQAAQLLGVNDTDLRCLVALNDRGALTAGKISKTLDLTKGATSTAVRRLQRKRLVTIKENANDRRSIFVSLTKNGKQKMTAIWKPMRENGFHHLNSYTPDQLQLFEKFFSRSEQLQIDCSAIIKSPAKIL